MRRFLLLAVAAAAVPACGTEENVTILSQGTGPKLSALSVSPGVLSPAFSPEITVYTVSSILSGVLDVTPFAEPTTSVTVNGKPLSGGASAVELSPGLNVVDIRLSSGGTSPETSYLLLAHLAEQEVYVKASNTGQGDLFGTAVALSGNTMVVGAIEEDDIASNSGAAYVFRRSGGTWSQEAYLKASNAGFGDKFGASVAIFGDTIVIGAPNEDSSTTGVDSIPNESAPNSGAAYVFRRSGVDWTQEAYLKASNTTAPDAFGCSVAISGDTIVVGAFGEHSSTTGINSTPNVLLSNAGAAYVFRRSEATWSQEAYLKASNTGDSDYFGASVAISLDTIVVGAYREDSSTTGVGGTPNENAPDSGAAYVFRRSGTSWAQEAFLKASNAGADDSFGFRVGISGDTLVVGASGEDSSSTGVDSTPDDAGDAVGAAYVFRRTGGAWTQEAYLKASNAGTFDVFGASVAISGDTIVVGAPGEASSVPGINTTPDETAYGAGAAYVFRRSGTAWSEELYLKASNPGDFFQFGTAAAVSGDTSVFGAIWESSSTTGIDSTPDNAAGTSGAAYVFRH